MPVTVGSHQQSTFTTPTNSPAAGSALDANVVRGNDNSLRATYNAHDIDETLHIQSSVLASRPAAGTAGRLWYATDTSFIYYDNGAAWIDLITGAAAAGTLTGATLAANVLASSLTSVGTLSALAMANGLLTNPKLQSYGETRTVPTISAGTLTLDLSLSNVFRPSVSANITTLTISNPKASGTASSFTVLFDIVGAFTITWPASIKWPSGTAPTLTVTAGKVDIFSFLSTDGGTTWYGFTGGQNF